MKVASGVTIFGVAIFVPILVLALFNVGAVQGNFDSPAANIAILLASGVAGIAAWLYGMRGFLLNGSLRMLAVNTGILVGSVLIGIIGFAHILRGEAMAEWYLRLGTVFFSLFLFLSAGFTETRIALLRRRAVAAAYVIVALLLLAGSFILTDSALQNGIFASATVGKWTPLGRFLQIVSIMFFTVAAVRYLHGAFLIRSELALALATGTVLLAMSGLTFVSVNEWFDPFFWASHLWLLMGFVAFLWGGFASREPHAELHDGEL